MQVLMLPSHCSQLQAKASKVDDCTRKADAFRFEVGENYLLQACMHAWSREGASHQAR